MPKFVGLFLCLVLVFFSRVQALETRVGQCCGQILNNSYTILLTLQTVVKMCQYGILLCAGFFFQKSDVY